MNTLAFTCSSFKPFPFAFPVVMKGSLHKRLHSYKTVTLAAYTKNEHESTKMFPVFGCICDSQAVS